MGFVESLKGLIYDILHNLDRINVDYITSNGLNPLRIRHDSGGLIEFKSDGKAYYNGIEIGSGAVAADHGSLTGLADYDHDQYLRKNGGQAMTGSLSMNNYDIANVNHLSGRLDAELDIYSSYRNLTLSSVSGYAIVMNDPVQMGANKIIGLGAAVVNGDALRYEQVIGVYLPLAGGTMASDSSMSVHDITADASGTIVTGDHGAAATDEVVNVCYGTSATPPTVTDTTIGTLYIQYTP